MSDVSVKEPHNLSETDAIARVQSFEEMLQKYGVKSTWKGPKAELKGTGVSGSIAVTTKDVTVTLKLGLLAKAAGVDAERLAGSIAKRLKSALGG